jgi:hypothetical protein
MITADETKEAPAPLHPFEVSIKIGGNDWPYVLQTVKELAEHLEQHGPDCTMASGGWSGCHSVDVRKRDISAEDYRRELDQWFQALKQTPPKVANL